MQEQINRMTASIDSDPALAIGSAKELIETCCKTILAERRKPAKGSEDVLELVKAARAELKLLPDNVPNAAKGAETIKRLLSNLATVAQGLAELRGLYGTGHGRDGKAKGVKPRHARLAVFAASPLRRSLSSYLRRTKISRSDPISEPAGRLQAKQQQCRALVPIVLGVDFRFWGRLAPGEPLTNRLSRDPHGRESVLQEKLVPVGLLAITHSTVRALLERRAADIRTIRCTTSCGPPRQ
jgi:hypothetical protein